MAKKAIKSNSNDEAYFIIPIEKKKKILGFFLALISLLLLLSILSYSEYDRIYSDYSFFDLFKAFSGNNINDISPNRTYNWLGLFGALVSDFMINSLFGYFSIAIPAVIFIWAYSFIIDKNYKSALNLTNLFLIASLIMSIFFGVLRFNGFFEEFNVLSGNIGFLIANGLGKILGGLGSFIFSLFTIFIFAFIVFDIKFDKIFEFLKGLVEDSQESISNIKDKNKSNSEVSDNLAKVSGSKVEKKKKRISSSGKDDLSSEEISPPQNKEPVISIINKDNERTRIDNNLIEEEIKLPSVMPKDDEDEIDRPKNDENAPEQWEEEIKYIKPHLKLLDEDEQKTIIVSDEELRLNATRLKEKLELFDIQIKDIKIIPGPVVTLFEIVPEEGVKISRIVSLEQDIALALAARGIRIIAPIPGKSAIGVEIPNAEAATVKASTIIRSLNDKQFELPLALGKTIAGENFITDLAKMPHLLIAGSTGSGKSVGINLMLTSLLYAKHPSEVKFVIIDPKKIELTFYKKLSKHFLAVSPDLEEEIITTPQNSVIVLKAVEFEMEKRYELLANLGVRNIIDYNEKVLGLAKQKKTDIPQKHHKIPYIVVVIDELADLMMTSGKEVEEPIARLAQMARAVGIHLILATQRPSVNVITGVIKANFSARIAYQVASKIDSRTILDMNGAEQLLGKGDMLFLPGGMPKPIRIQNAFISTDEVEKVTDHIYVQKGYSKRYLLPSLFARKKEGNGNFIADLDEMFEEAARLIVRHQQGSVSLLQRKLKLGYGRAARIVDQLEEAGIVGPADGSKAREVRISSEEELEEIFRSL